MFVLSNVKPTRQQLDRLSLIREQILKMCCFLGPGYTRDVIRTNSSVYSCCTHCCASEKVTEIIIHEVTNEKVLERKVEVKVGLLILESFRNCQTSHP